MSPALRTVPESMNYSKPSLVETTCACTLCSCTMSLKDLPAHNRGRRHQLALSKLDTDLRPLPESLEVLPAVNRRKDTQGRGIVGSDKTISTTRHFKSLAFHDSADPPVGSSALETVTGSTFSADTVKQKMNKAKRSKKVKQSKCTVEKIATPPVSTGLDSSGFNDSGVGFFIDSFPSDLQNNRNSSDFVYHQDCGGWGQSMSHLANKYNFFKSLLTMLLYLF